MFTQEFLQARVDELTALGLRQDPDRTVAEILDLVRRGQAGEEMDRWDAQVYAEALELLCASLEFRRDVHLLLDALTAYLAEE